MASGGSSKETGASRRPRTAAEQRAERSGTTSNDPEVLAAEIEKTREELAETLDAIADKVSPKRVASRTKKKVGDAVKDGAEGAAATVKAGTSQLKEAVSAKAETATEAVKEKAAVAKDKVTPSGGDEGLGEALEGVGQDPGAAAALAAPTPAVTTPAGSPGPSSLRAVPPPPAPATSSPLPLGPPAAVGALAAALVALLLLRRRRSARRRWH